uniref:Uncharacterized protein n=1 Tax=Aureoumbra lagunensis TaxID=44058 RepID=A0A7S3NHK6_9STRA
MPDASRGAAFSAAGFYAFSPLVWQYSTTAEVFALNNALNALILSRAIAFARKRQIKDARLGALLCGLALCNQHTALLFEIPLVLWMISMLLKQNLIKTLPSLIGIGLFGLLPYLYLPLATPKQGSWGNVHSFNGFLHHFLRRDYGTLRLYSGAAKANDTTLQRVSAYFIDVAKRQSNPLYTLPVLAFVGFLGLLFDRMNFTVLTDVSTISKNSKQRRKSRLRAYNEEKKGHGGDTNESAPLSEVALPLAATLWFYLFLFHSLSNLPLDDPLLYGVHARFWMQPNLIIALFAGIGIEVLAKVIGSRLLNKPKHQPAARLAVLLIATQLQLGIRPGGAPGSIFLAGLRKTWNIQSSLAPPAWYFHNYARALLTPLPKNALLLVNYDQQWTSLRYQQVCEGYRTDVTVLQLSMMTYGWWETRRKLYPHINWPGTHYTKELTVDWAHHGGFTFKELLDANYATFSGNVFFGGKLSYADTGFHQVYDFIPYGLLKKIIHKQQSTQSLESIVKSTRKVWNITLSQLTHHSGIPIEPIHSEETWEWTINRELFDHIAERAAFILERAIAEADSSSSSSIDEKTLKRRIRHLFEAAIWLEYCIKYDNHLTTAAVKNSGLADVHIVKSPTLSQSPNVTDLFEYHKVLAGPDQKMKTFSDLFPQAFSSDYKTWASERFMYAWGDFLQREDARNDAQYDTIKDIYMTVTSKGRKSPSSS